MGIDNGIIGEDWFLLNTSNIIDGFNKNDFKNNYSQFTFSKDDINMKEGLNFDIYKYGDLNDSYSFTRSEEKAALTFENVLLEKDKQNSMQLSLGAENLGPILGAQFSIVIDNATILNINHEYGNDLEFFIVGNKVRVSYVGNKAVNELIFELDIKSLKHQQAKNIIRLEEDFIREFITEDFGVYDIELNSFDTQSFDEVSIEPSVILYPNPASEYLNINVPNSFVGQELQIFNIHGQIEMKTQLTKSNKQIFIGDKLSKGIKIIKINGLDNQKIIVQ